MVTIITPVFNEEEGLTPTTRPSPACCWPPEEAEFRIRPSWTTGRRTKAGARSRRSASKSPFFSAISLSRNFGAHVALSAGIAQNAAGTPSRRWLATSRTRRRRCWSSSGAGRRATNRLGPSADAAGRERASRAGGEAVREFLRRYTLPSGSLAVTGSFLLMDQRVADCFREFSRNQSRHLRARGLDRVQAVSGPLRAAGAQDRLVGLVARQDHQGVL